MRASPNVKDQFSPYSYGPTSLADGTYFVPPANTIIYSATMLIAAVAAKDAFHWTDGESSERLDDAFVLVGCDDKNALWSPKVCDGTYMKIRNGTGGAEDIHLRGVSFA